MKQTERIMEMERRLERASTAVMKLSAALEQYADAQEDIMELEAYYGSEEWKRDYADDEAGKLPDDLKRGVLSEDGVWNLLSDNRDLKERMLNMVKKQ